MRHIRKDVARRQPRQKNVQPAGLEPATARLEVWPSTIEIRQLVWNCVHITQFNPIYNVTAIIPRHSDSRPPSCPQLFLTTVESLQKRESADRGQKCTAGRRQACRRSRASIAGQFMIQTSSSRPKRSSMTRTGCPLKPVVSPADILTKREIYRCGNLIGQRLAQKGCLRRTTHLIQRTRNVILAPRQLSASSRLTLIGHRSMPWKALKAQGTVVARTLMFCSSPSRSHTSDTCFNPASLPPCDSDK